MFRSRHSGHRSSHDNNNKGGEGPGQAGFGRRVSLSGSSGDRKYGGARDDDTRHILVRHVPIVIEADEDHEQGSDNESSDSGVVTYSGHTKLITRGSDRVPINYTWSISYTDSDRSSLSSGSSDNSVEARNNKNYHPVPPPRAGLNERKNLENQRNMKTSINTINSDKKYSGTNSRISSSKTTTNNFGGKENEMMQGKEAGKNRFQVYDNERKTDGRKLTNSTRHQQPTKSSGTAGHKNCPVHGSGDSGARMMEAKKPGRLEYLSRQLKSPSLLSISLQSKSSTKKSDDKSSSRANTTVQEKSKQTIPATSDTLDRGRLGSIRRHKSNNNINNNKEETQQFQRRWSFRLPSSFHSSSQSSGKSQQSASFKQTIQSTAGKTSTLGSKTIISSLDNDDQPASASSSTIKLSSMTLPASSSSSSLWSGPLKIPDYFRKVGEININNNITEDKNDEPAVNNLKRFVSHTDLSKLSDCTSGSVNSFAKTPSSSTSSIPTKVNSEYGSEGKPPQYVGILKTPGRRKNSSNRVEFLDNLQEKEIPGRYA